MAEKEIVYDSSSITVVSRVFCCLKIHETTFILNIPVVVVVGASVVSVMYEKDISLLLSCYATFCIFIDVKIIFLVPISLLPTGSGQLLHRLGHCSLTVSIWHRMSSKKAGSI